MPEVFTDALPGARVVVGPGGKRRAESGHPWIHAGDVVSGPAHDVRRGGPPLVRVDDARGRTLGLATFTLGAPVALRLLTLGEALPAPRALLHARLAAALALRAGIARERTALRLVHGEGDALPGLFVDRYADTLVVQTATCAMDAALPEIVAWLRAHTGCATVVERNDGSMRDFEALPRRCALWDDAGVARPAPPEPLWVDYRLGPVALRADLLHDGKTGGFLDQADNHAAVAAQVRPGLRVLDAFAFHGGFGLAAAHAGAEVLALEGDARAAARLRDNAERNGLAARVTVEQGDAFAALARLEAAARRFDVVVLDPPALAKRAGARAGEARGGGARAAALRAASRGYGELLLRGVRLCAPGGLLVACSCSGQVERALWDELVGQAAARAGRAVQVLARRGAGADHPERLGVPETGHLKCWLLRVLD